MSDEHPPRSCDWLRTRDEPVEIARGDAHDQGVRLFPSVLASTFVAWLIVPAAHAETELKNDGFDSGESVGVESGFVQGEIVASRFQVAGGAHLLKVRIFFGGGTATKTMTLKVWDDTAGGAAPGPMLFEGDFDIAGANDVLHDLDVSGDNVFVPAQFRVGLEFNHRGLPSLARDDDGSISANNNFMFTIPPSAWSRSVDNLLTGDWIIRAVVADGGGSPDAGVTPDASTGSPDASSGGPDAGSGNVCTGNGDCEIGEYCDLDVHTCTFDCRHDSDCPSDGECNSLGQCIGADGGGGGCCETGTSGGAGALGAIGLAGLVGLVVVRRRRPRAGEEIGRGSRSA